MSNEEEIMSNGKAKLPLKREFSSGGAVYKKLIVNGKEQIVWLIGKHSGYHKWVLPKGMIEPGERGIETAVRETREEMGVVAWVIGEKPIHKEQYFFVAELKKSDKLQGTSNKKITPIRRVAVYKENPEFEEKKGNKIKIFKTVTFYLMEYVSGDPKDRDFEMEEAGWYGFEEALAMLAFPGERQALQAARKKLSSR